MDADRVLERLRALPAGARLLDALSASSGVHLVGGAVRDLLLGGSPRDLDLVVEGDGPAVALALASSLGVTDPVVHGRFGTASVDCVNVATARTESYPRPGALPDVRPGTVSEDMARRDFTVNAIAVGVSPDRVGLVNAAPGAFEDLEARRLRVLHDASFVDDPTRLVRLARYAARLGFEVEEGTRRLALAAFAADAPASAGRARMGAELLLALAEPDPVAALAALRSLAGDAALDPGLEIDEELLRRVAALAPGDVAALLAALARAVPRDELRAWLDDIHFREAGAVLDATEDPDGLAAAMRGAKRPSELWRLLRRRAPAAVALAGAVAPSSVASGPTAPPPSAEAAARRWLDDLRHVRLSITGDDLLRAGVPQGREVGERLEAALARKLDDGLATREEELAAALEGRG
jgi:tRNA nucleotidyltransferase (CCA-adding enzyme)